MGCRVAHKVSYRNMILRRSQRGAATAIAQRYNLAFNDRPDRTQGVPTWLKITVWGRTHSSPVVKFWERPAGRLSPAPRPVFRMVRKDGLASPVLSPTGLLPDHMRTGS